MVFFPTLSINDVDDLFDSIGGGRWQMWWCRFGERILKVKDGVHGLVRPT